MLKVACRHHIHGSCWKKYFTCSSDEPSELEGNLIYKRFISLLVENLKHTIRVYDVIGGDIETALTKNEAIISVSVQP